MALTERGNLRVFEECFIPTISFSFPLRKIFFLRQTFTSTVSCWLKTSREKA